MMKAAWRAAACPTRLLPGRDCCGHGVVLGAGELAVVVSDGGSSRIDA